jgi:hypothetical protein
MKRIIVLLAVGAILMLTFAAPALAVNTGEQKGPGATGPPISSGGQNTSAFHCASPFVIGERGAFVVNKKHVHNNCH